MVCYKLSFPFWFTTACIAVATNCMSSGSWPHFQSNDYLLLAQLKLSTGKNFKRYNDYYISNTWKRFLWTASGSKSQAADIRVVFNIFHEYFEHAIVIYIACFPWTERTTIKTNDCTQAKERQRSCSYEQYSSLWRDSFRTTCIPSDRRIIETFPWDLCVGRVRRTKMPKDDRWQLFDKSFCIENLLWSGFCVYIRTGRCIIDGLSCGF